MKKCSVCAIDQSLDNFYKSGTRIQTQCKKCLYVKQRARVLANKESVAAYQAMYYQENKSHLKSYYAEWRLANRERLKAIKAGMKDWWREYNREYHLANRERVLERQRQYKIENKEKLVEYRERNADRDKAVKKVWESKNRHALNARAAKRRSALRNAVPIWADFEKIASIYAEAQKSPGLHVDHIVPIISDIVCGLHCEANLRVIPASENLSKSNRYWPDMP